ncbi:MAG TPA: protein kinase [Blastocatellia bacterium]|nr:protein kinase [Blastocatellia bacterium]
MTPERYKEVGELYLAALEIDADRRDAFLARACGGDDALRQEVESLLGYREQRGIVDHPALEVAAQAMADDPTTAFFNRNAGHYRLLSLLGKGGMGEVYLALDTRLNRNVAIKLLPARFTQDAGRVRRFEQEARAASALNHPNIITVYEIGEAPMESGSVDYIVTEYVEGDTLRQRMANATRNRMKIEGAVDIAAQVAAALTAAHEAGIAHRDIKPENVMVRRDGYVKVLDFGLAKLTEPSSPAVHTQVPTADGASTEAGVVMGTPRYMSPEQARGEKVDARTDIFSLGVMLYEMVAGRAPFSGATTSEVIAAILRDESPPLAECVPDAPPELERIVGQALRKNRADRYQNASDLSADLKQLQREMEFAAEEKKRSGRYLAAYRTLNKHRRAAIVALAGLIIAAMVVWFYFNRAPVLTDKDTILLADFKNKTNEPIFDGALKQALAIQLEQSPFLSLFPESQAQQTMREMNLPAYARMTVENAREICERHNLKALIAGEIDPSGSHYVITLQAINGQSGATLAREQVEAKSREQTLSALSKAATRLRQKLGESLRSIQSFDRPLEQATTAKLEAFKAWSAGVERSYTGGPMEAIPLYKLAVELDPEFAHAYSILAAAYWTSGQMELAAEAAEKGYKVRDKVNEYEKLRITNFYHGFTTGNLEKRIETLMLIRRIYPRERLGPTDFALTYTLLGQYDQAVAEAHEAIRLSPNFALGHRMLGWALLRLNRFGEAKEAITRAKQQQMDTPSGRLVFWSPGDAIARAQSRKIDTPDFHTILYQIAFIDGDVAGMRQQLDWVRGRPYEHVAFDWEAGAAAFAGQWRKAQGASHSAVDLIARGDTKEVAARYATEQALRAAVFGDCRQAGADAALGLRLARGRASLPRAALALALCGEIDRAKPFIDELAKRYPEDTLVNSIWLPTIRAAMELERGRTAEAIEQLLPASRYEAAAEFWPQYLRGQAYLQLKQGAKAGAEFQKILAHRGYAPLSPLYPLAHLGLARAAALTGNAPQSRKSYEDFFAVWKDADADLPVFREAKRGL